MLKPIFVSLATVTVIAAAPVAAAPAADRASVVVPIGDLDLATSAGSERLQRRLRGAATEICGAVPILPLAFKASAQLCHAEVLASAKEQVALAMARAQTHVQLARRSR